MNLALTRAVLARGAALGKSGVARSKYCAIGGGTTRRASLLPRVRLNNPSGRYVLVIPGFLFMWWEMHQLMII